MKGSNILAAITVVLILVSNSLKAQIINVPKSNQPINFDGVIDAEEWRNALIFDDFKQLTPNLGSQSSEKAEVRVMYDDQYIYIGGISYFNNPSQIFATTLERDTEQSNDDYIEIHLDTYNDKNNSLVFRTNPLGARQDFEITGNDDRANTSWNTFWDARSTINKDNWSTEIRIPFSSLRYKKGEENIMRIKAIVNYKEKNERILSPLNNTSIISAANHFTNSQEIKFQTLPSSKPIYITPYVKGSLIRQNELNEDQTGYESNSVILERKQFANNETVDKALSNIGLDLKFKPNANQTIDFTLNTDFAEVESDDRIINISRFPILLPEKRLFFLENADVFNSNQFGHRLFNSRRIGIENGEAVPIIGGLRFVGSNSNWQYGVLDMQTHKVDGLTASNNMSVIRLRRNIGKLGSNIGIINTNLLNKNDYNHLVAIDGNIRFTNIITAQFTTGATFDKQIGNWKPMYGVDLRAFRPTGFGINYRFRDYTEGFSPDLGFVSRPNTKRLTLNNGWRKTYQNPKFLRFMSMGNYTTKYWVSSTGAHEFFQTNLYFHMIHKRGARLTAFLPMYQEDNLYSSWEISEGVTIPEGHYKMWKASPSFYSNNTKPYQFSVDTEVGQFYGGNQFTLNYNVSYDFNKVFKAEIGGTNNRLKFPEEYTVNASRKINLNRYFSRLKFNFSAKSTLNIYSQYDTRMDKFGMNLRFRYNPTEGTDLYLVYNHNVNTNRDMLSPRLPFTDNQVFILKFSKTFLK